MTTLEESNRIRSELIALLHQAIQGFDESLPLAEQLDSLALADVAVQIEQQFGVSFFSVELAPRQWANLDSVVETIRSKLERRQAVK